METAPEAPAMPNQAIDNEIVIDWSQPAEAIEWDLAAGHRLRLGCSVSEARDRVIRHHLHYGELRPVGYFMRRYDHIPSLRVARFLKVMGLVGLQARRGQPQTYSDEEVPYALTIKDRLCGKGRPPQKDRGAPDAWMSTFCQLFETGDWGKPETRHEMVKLFDPTPNTRMHFVTVSRRKNKDGTPARGKMPDTPVEQLRDLTIYNAVKAFQAAGDKREIAIARVAHILRGGRPDDDTVQLRSVKGYIPGESTVENIVEEFGRKLN
jgi:hypothetical protein